MTLERVITLNNQVVSLLDCGQFHEAAHLVSTAMELFQQVTIPKNKEAPGKLPNTSSIDQCMTARGNHSSEEAADTDIGVFTYQYGITIPLAMVEDPTRIPPILIFNSGLSHQFLAFATPESSLRQHLLEKAIKLYKLAYTIEQHGEYNNNNIFKMAALNNLGVICMVLGEKEEAQRCFDYLVSMMMQLVQCGACSQMMNHLNGVWANLMINNVAPAA
ncbi:MAG: hypothetical protein SGBAC_008745 [Bacillariaceae sp.]